jgi:PTS system nitrogen regulatory IIA component
MSLRPQVVRVDLDNPDRESLFRTLVADLHERGCLSDPDGAVQRLRERERVQSTGTGGGIAFPHARAEGCPRPVVAAARLREAIDFDAPDGQPVDLVFLLLGPPDDPAAHVRLLAAIARIVKREDVVEALRAADGAEAFGAILAAG